MNADAFRYLYDYHFAENRSMWDKYIMPLSEEQFTQHVDYSHGSVLHQVIHLMSVDEAWFSELRGVEIPAAPDTESGKAPDRNTIRGYWDTVEQHMREYLAQLRNDMLLTKPVAEGEDKDLILWQILIQVINHGTDHRAQLLRILRDMGVKTQAQDFIFYAYDHPRP